MTTETTQVADQGFDIWYMQDGIAKRWIHNVSRETASNVLRNLERQGVQGWATTPTGGRAA